MRAHAVSQLNVEPSRPATTISQTTLHSPSLARSTRNTRALDSRVPPLALRMLCFASRHLIDPVIERSLVCISMSPRDCSRTRFHHQQSTWRLWRRIFKFFDSFRPAMRVRACHTLIAAAVARILHVYLPALPYDILRHMSGYVRLLLLTYSAVAPFSPPTLHARMLS